MTGMFGLANRPLEALPVKHLRDEVQDALLVRRTRNGVYDEEYFSSSVHISRAKVLKKVLFPYTK